MQIRKIKKLHPAYIMALIFAALLILASAALAEEDGMLRVLLSRLGAPSSVTLTADCDYVLEGDFALRIPAGIQMVFEASEGELSLSAAGRTVALGASARLTRDGGEAQGAQFLSPALSNQFCGDLTLTASENTVSTVLNIYIEDYLYGVVGYEMPPSSEIEALKAQAVAARNYALNRKAARTAAAYDLSDMDVTQVFKGYSASESYAAAIEAVDETRGMVLTYGGALASCYYGDSNGGQTESAANAIGTDLAYSAVADDPYDLEGVSTQKSAFIRKDAEGLDENLEQVLLDGMAAQLKEAGIDAGSVAINFIEGVTAAQPMYAAPSRVYQALNFRVNVTGKSAAGESRTATVSVDVPTYGALESWYGLDINEADNETVYISESDRAYEITFRRSGSGVGMSQRGAQAMAANHDSTYEEILDYYYPGTALSALELAAEPGSTSEAPAEEALAEETAAEEPAPAAQPETTPAPRQTQPAGHTELATARLNRKASLYQKPAEDSAAIATLAAGAVVEVYDVNGEWVLVGSSGKEGYIKADMLRSFSLPGATVRYPEGDAIVTVARNAALLQLPVRTAKVLAAVQAGTQLRLYAYTGAWALVDMKDNTTGFMEVSELNIPASAQPEITPAPAAEGGAIRLTDPIYAQVNQNASLYSSASEASRALDVLLKGAAVKVMGYNDAWAWIMTDGGEDGYVRRAALTVVSEETAAQAQESAIDGGEATYVEGEVYMIVADGALPVYRSYSEDSDLVGTLVRGERVQVIVYNSKWAGVRASDMAGFVHVSGLGTETEQVIDGGAVTRVGGERWALAKETLVVLYRSWSIESGALATLERGDRVRVIAYNSRWAYVELGGQRGYALVQGLEWESARQEEANTIVYGRIAGVITQQTAAYADASLTGAPIGTLRAGTAVTVLAYDKSRNLAYIEAAGHRGYVALQAVRKAQ